MRPFWCLSLSFSLAICVHAANDWSVPCHNGLCSYDLLQPDGSILATLNISGSPKAISDVTPAAGWTILGCDPDADAPEVRIVCTSAKVSDCDHLTGADGAHGKVVRLPDNCGKGPFGRVADHWLHDNQTLPPDIKAQLSRRSEPSAVVHGLRIDTDFAAIEETRFGPIDFSISSSAELKHNVQDQIIKRQTSNFNQQGQFSPNALQSLVAQVFNSFILCSGPDPGLFTTSFQGSVNISRVDVAMNVLLGVQGTLAPARITSFALTAIFGADIVATVALGNVAVTGFAGTGTQRLLAVPMTSFSFPGILDINPTFVLDIMITSSMGFGTNYVLGFEYHTDDALFNFPQSLGPSQVSFTPGNIPLKIVAGLNAPNQDPLLVTLDYHFTPGVLFSLVAFSGVGKSTISLSFDAAARTLVELLPPIDIDPNTINPIFDGSVCGITTRAQANNDFFGLFNADTAFTVNSQAFFMPFLNTEITFGTQVLSESAPSPVQKRQSSLSCVQHPPNSFTVFSTTIPAKSLRACGTVDDCF